MNKVEEVKTETRAKSVLKREEKEKLLQNLKKLKDIWYTDAEIWGIIDDYKQVVSNINTKWMDYPISLKKAKEFNTLIENFISTLPTQ